MNSTEAPPRQSNPEIVILGATRTPIGRFQGALASVTAPKLGAIAIAGAAAQACVAATEVSDVVMGNVLQAGLGQAPARQAALLAGLSHSTRTFTLNQVCGSGLQAIRQASLSLATGPGKFAVAGGMENMSLAPYLMPGARTGYRLGHRQVIDSVVADGLWDAHHDLHMGSCAEKCAEHYGFTRNDQDAYAIASFRRAQAAQRDGLFSAEITPVEVPAAKVAPTAVAHDEGPDRVSYEKIPTLQPAFATDGTITAANASSLNDGAAALVLATAATATARGLRPLARLVSFGAHAHDPFWFTTAPVQATQHALHAANWTINDVDLWEVNEAFAVVPLAFMRELGVAHDRLNVRGGALALGHPIGCSGARIVVTLLAALRERGLNRGVAAICIGGGEGLAVCLELP